MKLNIFAKLFMAILVATMAMTVFMVIFTNWSVRQGFADYQHQDELDKLNQLAEVLAETYAHQGNWDFLLNEPANWRAALTQVGEGRSLGRLPGNDEPFARVGQALSLRSFGLRIRLLDLQENIIAGMAGHAAEFERRPVTLAGQTIGWLELRRHKPQNSEQASRFMEQQVRNIYLIALFAAGVSLLIAVILVRHLLRPVKHLTEGAQALSRGNFNTLIQVKAGDELGQLAHHFNQLSHSLQRNQTLRTQWIADISHELRTPIAILRSEIEAMLDGIRKPTLERISSLHHDVLALGKLVDDLYQLSLSDAGELELPDEDVDLCTVLQDALEAAETRLQEKSLQLGRPACDHPLIIRGDGKRLFQLFSNLLENSYRYTDPGGRVVVGIHSTPDNKQAVITLEDSAPGVPDEALPRLFERLFRVDKSRSRLMGGSGLGLSISRNIVEAHGGKITAVHSRLGGLLLRMSFPLRTPSSSSNAD
ncbi:MAG: HAMP domain-containing protein [Thiothrix sp.]|nr:HAMP domain-containing protein [Thiothrix sp.]